MASQSSVPLPSLRHNIGSIVVPGDKIGRIIVDSIDGNGEKIMLLSGPGTYTRSGQIHASILGTLQGKQKNINDNDNENNNIEEKDKRITNISMELYVEPSKGYFAQSEVLNVGQIILGRIIRIQNSQQAIVSILAINNINRLLKHNPEGIIRKEDVRSNINEQQIQIQNSFQTNDIIIAKILSLGDSRRYFLSTAESSLGVIHAISSISNKPMIPISWKEMECPVTGIKESRKCAKPPNNVVS